MAKSSTTATKTFPTHIDLPEQSRAANIELLNQQLADTFDLYSQIKQAHWNIKGPEFIALHELFDELADRVLALCPELEEHLLGLLDLATVELLGGRQHGRVDGVLVAVEAGFLDRVVPVGELMPIALATARQMKKINMTAHRNTKLKVRKALLETLDKAIELDRQHLG